VKCADIIYNIAFNNFHRPKFFERIVQMNAQWGCQICPHVSFSEVLDRFRQIQYLRVHTEICQPKFNSGSYWSNIISTLLQAQNKHL
jgi:hypothetical protein